MPYKSLLCVDQFILLICLIPAYEDNLYVALADGTPSSASTYKDAKRRLVACIVVFFITLSLEFAAMFTGISVYFDKVLASQVVLHMCGCITTALFMEREWDGETLWGIWTVFRYTSFLPARL